jgi:DUF1009 family protein
MNSPDHFTQKKIGLIAGGGQFPLLFAQAAKLKGLTVHAAAYHKETDPTLDRFVDTMEWFYLGQLKRLIKYFHQHDVSQAAMMGTIHKTSMFTDVKPDMKAITVMAGLRTTHDDAILKKFAECMEKEGIRILPSTLLLPELLARTGIWTRRKPSRVEKKDFHLGWTIARHVGQLDLGQCVVVGGGTVLAVEAVEGTDAAIKRGGELGKGHAVAIKISKPSQDLRFDIPAVGLGTIESMHAADVRALAILADKTVVFDRKAMIEQADAWGIAIAAYSNAQFDNL